MVADPPTPLNVRVVYAGTVVVVPDGRVVVGPDPTGTVVGDADRVGLPDGDVPGAVVVVAPAADPLPDGGAVAAVDGVTALPSLADPPAAVVVVVFAAFADIAAGSGSD